MRIQTLNRTDPEKVFLVVENQEGSQLVNGDVVEWDLTNTVGWSVEKSDALRAPVVAGVVSQTIDTSGIGLIQVRGIHTAVKTTTTVTAEAPVVADTSGKCVAFTASTTVLNVTTAGEICSILGVCIVVTDTNSSQIMLRL